MKKEIVIIILFALFLFVISNSVIAKSDNAQSNSGSSSSSSNSGKSNDIQSTNAQSDLKSGNSQLNSDSNPGKSNSGKSNTIIENSGDTGKKIKSSEGEFGASTNLEVQEENTGDKSKIKVKLSNGNTKELKVTPDEATIAATGLVQGDNMTVTLNESSDGKVFYYVSVNKTGRLFGIFKIQSKQIVEINAETGQVLLKKKPWYGFLITSDNSNQTSKQIIICHIPPGNPSNKQTITVGSPALKAHLAHGDTIGQCSSGNQTIPPNQTSENLSLNIISPQNTTYINNSVLIEILSNGNVRFSIDNASLENYNSSIFREFQDGTYILNAYASKDNSSLEKSIIFSVLSNITGSGNQTIPPNQTSNSSV